MKSGVIVAIIIIVIAVVAFAWYTGILKIGTTQAPAVTSASQAGKLTTDISSTIDQIGSSLSSIQSKLG